VLELESEHGRRVMGILLFQDLAVVPLLILIPALGSASEQLLPALGWALIKAVVLVGLLLTGGQRFMRWWLTLVARRKSEELFMLNLLLITLGLAWLTELAGLSLALGAFIAGVLVSETEYRHQVGTDIRPFHDVLLGLFFITIGMMLDWHILVDRWALVLALLAVPLLVKAVIILVLARLMGATTGVALRSGLFLAQAGEFGFVLLSLTQDHGLVQPALMNPILAAMVLSMLATPFLIMYSNRIVMKLVASDWMQQSLQMTTIARKTINTSKHVIICGYGRCGQNLARMLEREGIPYMALDLDPDRVRQAAAAGDSVVYGDATRLQALMAAGLVRASAVVVTYIDVPAALKVLANTRSHAPQVPVVVRTQDDAHLDKLQDAGATEVVPEAIEGSLMLASHALALVGVPMRRVLRVVQDQRDARYNMLRGYFHGADDDTPNERDQERMSTVSLPPGAKALGSPLGDLALTRWGCAWSTCGAPMVTKLRQQTTLCCKRATPWCCRATRLPWRWPKTSCCAAIENVRRVLASVPADQLVRFEPGAEVAPGITSVAAFGHTPGHTLFTVKSEGQSFAYVADLTNVPSLFARSPDWSVTFDMDKEMARATRRKMFDMIVKEKMMAGGFHFPFPAFGTIDPAGNGYQFKPVA
jgi:CPA2 family monovalent cation:H+ antiporter-2